MPELRDYQAELVEKLRESIRSGKRRPIVRLPTGGGKTALASHIIGSTLRKGKRVTFTVPAISLIDQTRQSFWNDGIRDTGVIQANHIDTDWSKPVQVASVQTLARRKFPETDLVIVDEAHLRHKIIERWMQERQDILFVGLSATPWSRGLGTVYDDLVCTISTQGLIDAGYLSGFRVFAPSHPDLSGVRVVRGDYDETQLGAAMDKAPLVADIVETWIRLGEGRPTIVFCVNRSHARHVHERFEAAGVRAAYIDAETPLEERNEIGKSLESGDINVVVNIFTLTTGVDWPFVTCISYARPTKSEIFFVQAVGRGLRLAPNGDDLLLLDHSDTSLKLGFVTDIDVRHAELDDGKRKERESKDGNKSAAAEKLPAECVKCHALRSPGIAACTNCGHVPTPPRKDVESIDGELKEITRGRKGKLAPPGFISLRGIAFPLGEFYGMLKRHSKERGFKDGWAANQYKSATNEWPNAYKLSPEIDIAPEVAMWIKSRMIRFAKRRAKESASAAVPNSVGKATDAAEGNDAVAALAP